MGFYHNYDIRLSAKLTRGLIPLRLRAHRQPRQLSPVAQHQAGVPIFISHPAKLFFFVGKLPAHLVKTAGGQVIPAEQASHARKGL